MAIKVFIRRKPDREHLLLFYDDPATGREVSKTAGTSDKGEAERAAANWESELLKQRGENDTGWAYFRSRFEREHTAALARKTQFSYATAFNHFDRLCKVATVNEVTPSVISRFRAALLSENRKLTSIANYLRHIKKALNWAEEIEMIPKAPKFSMPKTGKRKFMRGRPLTQAEYGKMLKAAPDAGMRRYLELLWLSGFRLREALSLSWDLEPVTVALNAKPHPQVIFMLEGHKSRQDDAVPIAPDFAAWLGKTPAKARHGLVAPMPLSADRVSEAISEIGKSLKIVVNEEGKHASAHDFRRSFGTRWAAVVRPLTLQRMMRHANIETTLKYYVGLSSADAGSELWSQGKAAKT